MDREFARLSEGMPLIQGIGKIHIRDDGDQSLPKGRIRPEANHGSVYDLFRPAPVFRKPSVNGTQEEIETANGRQNTVNLNGVIILDATWTSLRTEFARNIAGALAHPGHIGVSGPRQPCRSSHIGYKALA